VRALAQVSGDTQNDAEMRAVEILAHISKFKDESAKLIESLRDNIADYEESLQFGESKPSAKNVQFIGAHSLMTYPLHLGLGRNITLIGDHHGARPDCKSISHELEIYCQTVESYVRQLAADFIKSKDHADKSILEGLVAVFAENIKVLKRPVGYVHLVRYLVDLSERPDTEMLVELPVPGYSHVYQDIIGAHESARADKNSASLMHMLWLLGPFVPATVHGTDLRFDMGRKELRLIDDLCDPGEIAAFLLGVGRPAFKEARLRRKHEPTQSIISSRFESSVFAKTMNRAEFVSKINLVTQSSSMMMGSEETYRKRESLAMDLNNLLLLFQSNGSKRAVMVAGTAHCRAIASYIYVFFHAEPATHYEEKFTETNPPRMISTQLHLID